MPLVNLIKCEYKLREPVPVFDRETLEDWWPRSENFEPAHPYQPPDWRGEGCYYPNPPPMEAGEILTVLFHPDDREKIPKVVETCSIVSIEDDNCDEVIIFIDLARTCDVSLEYDDDLFEEIEEERKR